MIVRSKAGIVAPALAILILGALTACSPSSGSSGGGSSTGGGSSSGQVNVCNLISASTAGSAVGQTFSGAKSSSIDVGEDACTYATSAAPAALIITVYQPSTGMTWTTMKSVLESLGPVTPVSGIGDNAELGKDQLSAQSGSRVIAIEGNSVTSNPSGAEALAKKLISALG
jgi:hypothetical protein